MAPERVAPIGLQSGEVSVGPLRDLIVERGGDFIPSECVDFGGEGVKLLLHGAR